MGIFNSFRQHLRKYLHPEEYNESKQQQKFLNKRLFELRKQLGGSENHSQCVEFFFYTNDEDKANNLAIDLNGLSYEVYGVHQSLNNEWAITGCTTALDMNEESLTRWSEEMCALGLRNDCRFDGWGALIE